MSYEVTCTLSLEAAHYRVTERQPRALAAKADGGEGGDRSGLMPSSRIQIWLASPLQALACTAPPETGAPPTASRHQPGLMDRFKSVDEVATNQHALPGPGLTGADAVLRIVTPWAPADNRLSHLLVRGPAGGSAASLFSFAEIGLSNSG